MTMRIHVTVNGTEREVDVVESTTLLDFVRDDLHLTGTKECCDLGECGACTLLVEGRAVNSCLMLAAEVEGGEITTIEGLNENGKLSPVQVRSERNGNPKTPGNGRVYHINFTASDSSGASCTGVVLVCVPHDQGGRPAPCVDEGSLFKSTQP